MTVRTIAYLKERFQAGDKPTQQDFWDLFETMLTLETWPNPLPPSSAENLTNIPIPDPLPPVSGEFLTNINRSDWVAISVPPTYATSTSFTVPGDFTGPSYFVVGRRIRIHLNPDGYYFGTVTAATYAAGLDTTTVTVDNEIPTSALAAVDVNLFVDSDIVITSLSPGSGAALSVYRKNAGGTNVESWMIPVASQGEPSLLEVATNAEVQTGTDTGRAVTPAGLMAAAAVAATANRLVRRDAAGRAQVADPVAPADVVTKQYLDSYLGVVPGTRMVFAQAAAPLGWTQDTLVNDRVLRVVSGAGGGNGGSWTVSGLTADGTALTKNQLPAHYHFAFGGALSGNDLYGVNNVASTASFNVYDSTAYTMKGSQYNPESPPNIGRTSDTGAGQTHGHTVSSNGTWRPAYSDVIVAVKN